MELQVSEIQALEPIKFNYEELKTTLAASLEKYKNLIYTEENIKEAKADRALLNKVSTAINDEKKRIKNKLLEPYMDFEEKCKELMAMVTEVSSGIDLQVKSFEDKKKEEKLKEIMEYWIENVGEFNDLIDFDLMFEERWLNVSYTMKNIKADITHIFEKTKLDLNTLDTTISDKNILNQVKDFYFNNMKSPTILSLSLQEAKRIEESSKKIEELEAKQETIENKTENNTNNTQEELKQIDFRVWVSKEQMMALKEFLKTNNIKYGRVE